ncbi:L-serine ammonia-lyase [Rickettsiella massiliensis]|uniref:L-serine ammonia-lyase n=1 Tax=Rickettsiella massiliensis TaxID=676517 RepID=UPI00228735C8|nr:L-serine ammonia-lyase [Rickettsiella massiliensis]
MIDTQQLSLAGQKTIHFCVATDLLFQQKEELPLHPNAMRFTAFNHQGSPLQSEVYYSIGGGFIVREADFGRSSTQEKAIPYAFTSAQTLFELCRQYQLSIAELMWANEQALMPSRDLAADLLKIANIMKDCVEKGCHAEGELPGGLHVRRRAPALYQQLKKREVSESSTLNHSFLWPTVYAMAVSEENAAGGRIVTAPTNGAAGIIPAVLTYFRRFHQDTTPQLIIDFLLTAGAIALLYKMNASISGAEVGCQGEVGVACSMAAGALTAVMGGSLEQIENAAEMAMEHHLGMTCDPVAGLVQIPCIERNGVAAEKAIKLAYLALLEDGKNKRVSLDKVIETMWATGSDMMSLYKETSLGGLAKSLAVNSPAC